MLKRLAVVLLAAGLLAVAPIADRPADAAVGRKRVVPCRAAGCWPAAFAFTPNGKKVFYAERFTGQIRVFNLETKRDRRWWRVPNVATAGEQGVLGLALDPRWRRGFKYRWVYLYYTHAGPLQNRIIRARKLRGGGTRTLRLATIPAASNHNGGVIHFGPDGKLYAVTGDAGSPSRSQDVADLAGKVLRMRKGGGRPAGNPFAGSRAYSFGHRNSFGFAFDPLTGNLWQTENGPECTDEMNLVQAGANYGWGPGSSCPNTSTEGPSPVAPERTYTPTIAPTGAAFCIACRLGGANNGALLFGAWNDGKIRRLTLTPNRMNVAAQATIYDHPRGVLAMIAAPDGRVYFSDPDGIYRLRRT